MIDLDFVLAEAGKRVRLDLAQEGRKEKARVWTAQEEQFLRQNLGVMSEEEMGRMLGRSVIGLHLHWKRDMRLPAPSKTPGILTASEAARLLGIDGHKVMHWVDKGLIPGYLMAGRRKIRLIKAEAFRRWVLDPMHWMYFKPGQVRDQELRHMLKLRAKRWGDEWWTTPMVARYHGLSTQEVKRYIKIKYIRATQIAVSYGGRHPRMRWKLWFVLKSEATRADLVFVRRGQGSPNVPRVFTERALKWIVEARDKHGMSFAAIARTMKMNDRDTLVRNWYCKMKGLSPKTRFPAGRGRARKKTRKEMKR